MQSYLKRSLYAGVLVGIGDIVYTLSGNQYIGAMLFSLALLTIINLKLNLYTGKIGFYKNYTPPFIINIFLMNLLGVFLVCSLFFVSYDELGSVLFSIAKSKFDYRAWSLYDRGILCGMCMYIAVSNRKQIITVFSVMTFILCGFRHCIADFPFLLLNFNIQNLIKFIMIVLGNSMGAIMINYLCTNNKRLKH